MNFCLLQVSNQELLHAVVALYDTCLPEITPEVLYPTVCGKWAKTLVLLRDFQGMDTCMCMSPTTSARRSLSRDQTS